MADGSSRVAGTDDHIRTSMPGAGAVHPIKQGAVQRMPAGIISAVAKIVAAFVFRERVEEFTDGGPERFLRRRRRLVFTWQRAFGAVHGASDQRPGFVPAVVRPEERKASLGATATVIVLAGGRRIIVDAGVDAAALAQVLEVVEPR